MSNFDICVTIIRELHSQNKDEIERDFIERYKLTLDSNDKSAAEIMALSETMYWAVELGKAHLSRL